MNPDTACLYTTAWDLVTNRFVKIRYVRATRRFLCWSSDGTFLGRRTSAELTRFTF